MLISVWEQGRLVQTNRRATAAQVAIFNDGYWRIVSQSRVHCTLLQRVLSSCRPIRVSMLTPVHHPKCLQWACKRQNWTLEQQKKVTWSNESHFPLHHIASLTLPINENCSVFKPTKNFHGIGKWVLVLYTFFLWVSAGRKHCSVKNMGSQFSYQNASL